jgi:hypothetical protein
VVRDNLLLVLGKRLVALPSQVKGNLATNPKYQWPMLFGYMAGAVSTLYSVLGLFYNFNLARFRLPDAPLLELYREQVLPFLASPLVYVGITLDRTGEALVALATIGGAILANAEFRTELRLLKHVFIKRYTGPEIDFSILKSLPGLQDPPAHTLRSKAGVTAAALLSGWTLLGLIPFLVFLPFGIYFFLRDLRYLLTWLYANLLYVFEHLLAPLERPGDDKYWGTRWFLAFFVKRQQLDESMRHFYIDFWRSDSLDPAQWNWTAAKRSILDGGRVVALALWLLVAISILQ